MESEYRKGYVYIQKIFAGTIAETEEGYEFSYNEDYLKREDAVSVSLTLPLPVSYTHLTLPTTPYV